MSVYDDILAELRAIRRVLEERLPADRRVPLDGSRCTVPDCGRLASVMLTDRPICVQHYEQARLEPNQLYTTVEFYRKLSERGRSW